MTGMLVVTCILIWLMVQRFLWPTVSLLMEAIVLSSAQGRVHCLQAWSSGVMRCSLSTKMPSSFRIVDIWQNFLDCNMRSAASLSDNLRHFDVLIFVEIWTELMPLSQIVELNSCLFSEVYWWQRSLRLGLILDDSWGLLDSRRILHMHNRRFLYYGQLLRRLLNYIRIRILCDRLWPFFSPRTLKVWDIHVVWVLSVKHILLVRIV